MSDTDRWFEVYRPVPEAKLRLFCLPHAGGGAQTFRLWSRFLPSWVEVCPVQLPGRWARQGEPPYKRMAPLASALVSAMEPLLDRPFALFGHSLGGLVAFEAARELRRRDARSPEVLLVSSRKAPDLPLDLSPVTGLGDEAFVAQVTRRYGGIPRPLLEEPEFLALLLPVLRADLALYESYVYAPEPPLSCPLVALGGEEDPTLDRQGLWRWRRQTANVFSMQMFPGDHFYLTESQKAFFATLGLHLHKARQASAGTGAGGRAGGGDPIHKRDCPSA